MTVTEYVRLLRDRDNPISASQAISGPRSRGGRIGRIMFYANLALAVAAVFYCLTHSDDNDLVAQFSLLMVCLLAGLGPLMLTLVLMPRNFGVARMEELFLTRLTKDEIFAGYSRGVLILSVLLLVPWIVGFDIFLFNTWGGLLKWPLVFMISSCALAGVLFSFFITIRCWARTPNRFARLIVAAVVETGIYGLFAYCFIALIFVITTEYIWPINQSWPEETVLAWELIPLLPLMVFLTAKHRLQGAGECLFAAVDRDAYIRMYWSPGPGDAEEKQELRAAARNYGKRFAPLFTGGFLFACAAMAACFFLSFAYGSLRPIPGDTYFHVWDPTIREQYNLPEIASSASNHYITTVKDFPQLEPLVREIYRQQTTSGLAPALAGVILFPVFAMLFITRRSPQGRFPLMQRGMHAVIKYISIYSPAAFLCATGFVIEFWSAARGVHFNTRFAAMLIFFFCLTILAAIFAAIPIIFVALTLVPRRYRSVIAALWLALGFFILFAGQHVVNLSPQNPMQEPATIAIAAFCLLGLVASFACACGFHLAAQRVHRLELRGLPPYAITTDQHTPP